MPNEIPVWERGWSHKIDEAKATQCLKALKWEYDKRGITWWLCFGSLLGAIRDGKPIPWDDDIDLGVFQKDRSKIKLANESMALNGFHVPETCMPPNDEVYIRDGQKIEVWVFDDLGNGEYGYDITRCPKIHYDKKFFDELEEIEFLGMRVKVPLYSAELLTIMYGDWNTPKEGYACHQF